jgi:hypothetical protein
MIEADSDKKSGHTHDKSDSCEHEIIEKLIGREEEIGLDIEHPTDIERYLYEPYDPKYRFMNSIYQDEEKYIYEWKVEHSSKYRDIRNFRKRMREKESEEKLRFF